MSRPLECTFCGTPLHPGQEFRYLVEIQTLDNPRMLEAIRKLPADWSGTPLHVCSQCQRGIESNHSDMIAEVARGEIWNRIARVLLLLLAGSVALLFLAVLGHLLFGQS